jgi:hypothetical protein
MTKATIAKSTKLTQRLRPPPHPGAAATDRSSWDLEAMSSSPGDLLLMLMVTAASANRYVGWRQLAWLFPNFVFNIYGFRWRKENGSAIHHVNVGVVGHCFRWTE